MSKPNRNLDGSLPTLPYLDDNQRIKTDLPCVICGYNLRSAHFKGSCPECGAPVEHAFLTPSHLGDRTWLRRVRFGAFAILFGAFLRFMLCCLPDLQIREEPLQAAMFFALGLPMMTGCFLFASREPGAKDLYTHNASRMALRACAVMEVLLVAIIPLSGALSARSAMAGGAVFFWGAMHLLVVAFIGRLVIARMQRMHSHWEKYFIIPAVVIYGIGLVILSLGATYDVPFGMLLCSMFLPAAGGLVLLIRMVELASRLYPIDPPEEFT